MADTFAQCPKCGHKFPQPLPASASCPACGIYLFKWKERAAEPEPSGGDEVDAYERDDTGFLARLFEPMERMGSAAFYGRCFVLAVLAVWSWFLIRYDYRSAEINSSFMHNILLPIHEAGHVLFRPFGEFMMVMGGSFFQLVLPLGIGIAFIVKNRDNFGAAVGIWWASVSLVDLSPYIYDSLHPQMILLGGGTGDNGGPHDWIYLLNAVGQLKNAQLWGALAHGLGALLMVLALTWGAVVLLQQHRQGLEE